MLANSKEWWEDYFKNNWEKNGDIDGKAQTRYFMKMLLKHTIRIIGTELSESALDWGCALGQGVDEISKRCPNCVAEGYDFSQTAIKRAKELFPSYTFVSQIPSKKYNFVITSNCLEHFIDPIFRLQQIMELSKNYVIIMTPYKEEVWCDTHPISIDKKTFPGHISDFARINCLVITSKNHDLYKGRQLLQIYQKQSSTNSY